MNWCSAKNKLIILFLSINIVLGWANYRKESTAYVLKETQVDDIKTILAENNIYIDTTIPKEYKPLSKLTVSPFQINSVTREEFVKRLLNTLEGVTVSIEAAKAPNQKPRRIYSKNDEIIIFEGENILYQHRGKVEARDSKEMGSNRFNKDQALKIAEKWLKQMAYSPRKMHRQTVEEADGMYIIYYDKYEGIPVFDSYVKIKMTSSGINEVEIHKVELGEAVGEKQEIYSGDQVAFYLIQLIATREPTHIKDIMLGYALENPKGTHLIAEKALPFYQVILEDGRVYYINAYNSEIREKPQI